MHWICYHVFLVISPNLWTKTIFSCVQFSISSEHSTFSIAIWSRHGHADLVILAVKNKCYINLKAKDGHSISCWEKKYINLIIFWLQRYFKDYCDFIFLGNESSVNSAAVHNYKAKRQSEKIKKQHLKGYFSVLCQILQYTACHHSMSTFQLSEYVSIWIVKNNTPRTSQMCWYEWPFCYCYREARPACGKAL